MKNIEILMLLIGILLPAIGSIIKSFKDKSSAKKQTKDSDMLPGNETEAEYYEFEDLEHDNAPKQEFDPFKEIFGDLIPKPQNAAPKPKVNVVRPMPKPVTVSQQKLQNNTEKPVNVRKRIEKVDTSIDAMKRKQNNKTDVKKLLRDPNSVKDAVILSEVLNRKF